MLGYVVFLGIVRKIYNPIPLKLSSIKKLLMGAFSTEISLAGMSSPKKSKMPTPFLLRSILKGLLKPSRTN